jgi:hypothetical protein
MRWGISGTGYDMSFWNFCRGDIDVLYLQMVINASGDIDLKKYCAEGSEIEGCLDASESSRTSIARALEEHVTSERELNKELAMKHRAETVSALLKQLSIRVRRILAILAQN